MTIKEYVSQIESFKGKTIALTGGTSGVGLCLLKHLIEKEAHVILLSRNLQKANSLKEIYKNIDVVKYDQSSFISIENAIDELLEKYPNIDTFVLNAGTLGEKQMLENGYHATIGINYIGVRHFIDTISPRLNSKVRFVVQGSIVAGCKVKRGTDLTKVKGTFPQYNISKAYLESYIYKLYKDNKYTNIEYVITEPGVTATNIIRHFNPVIRFLGKIFLTVFLHSPKKACLCLLTGISSKAQNGDHIVPRGLFTLSGFPKIKDLPVKRRRPYLFD